MTPKAPDYGHREADKELFALTRRLHLSYRRASISLQEKLEEYLEQFEKEDAMMRALYDSGELDHEDFLKWRREKLMLPRQWNNMLNQLAHDMTNQNMIAASMINDTLPGVYAINHNYGTYEAEVGSGIDTTYTMYDKHTVARLLKDNQDLLPEPSVPVAKDLRWNKQHIQSAVLQGVLEGEPMKDIAKRFRQVVGMTESAAMRNARTAVTGAENAGRIDSYKRAEALGIKMKQVWMATLDGRTRDSHAAIDGEKIDVGGKFSNGCRYPGDPEGSPAEIYNCRCTLVAEVEGSNAYDPSLRPSKYLEDRGLTYEQWKNRHITPKGSKLSDGITDIREKITDQIRYWNDEEYKTFKGKKISNDLTILCEKNNIKRVESHKLKEILTTDEIIDKICIDDTTDGSCVSLAFAYAGNKVGLDVTDDRRGKSTGIFSNFGWFVTAELKDVTHYEINENISDFVKAGRLLSKMDANKEYILSVGDHTSVVRKNGSQYEFLELQSTKNKGFHKLDYDILLDRFGCSPDNNNAMANLIDIESLLNNDDFRAITEYLNTRRK